MRKDNSKKLAFKAIACVADDNDAAIRAYGDLSKIYDFVAPSKADVIIALGGDGFMLHTMHEFMDREIPIYGMNCGTVGFLMNNYTKKDLLKSIENATPHILHPLRMIVRDSKGRKTEAYAMNEVSLLRQTRQAAQLKITVDKNVRMKELVCDGLLLATPAGSTAYNLSAQGPILPLGSNLLALTPISPFRPRRWKGALLNHEMVVKIDVIDSQKRPVSSVADFTEVRDVVSVEIKEERSKKVILLFSSTQSLEEKVTNEQFLS